MFFKVNPGHPQENTSNFKKYILRLSRLYHRPSDLERTLSPRTRNKTLKIKNLEEDLEKDQLN